MDAPIRFALLNAVIYPPPADLVCQNAVLISYFGSANRLGERNRIIIVTRLVGGGKSFDWVVLPLYAEQPAGE